MATASDNRPDWKTRFWAWWEGVEIPASAQTQPLMPTVEAKPPAPSPSPARVPGLDRHGKPLWNADRLQIAETMWGEGYVTPGGDEFVTELVKPFGLNSTMSVLDIGAGLGGSSRAIATSQALVTHSNCWVTGLEASSWLAEQGQERSQKKKLAKHAPIKPFDPENFNYAKRVNAVFAKECLFTIANKAAFFDGMKQCMKPQGQFVYIDYGVDDENVLPTLKSWMDQESVEPNIWAMPQTVTLLERHKFDVRVSENITPTYLGLITHGLESLRQHLVSHTPDQDTKKAILSEMELWVRRAAALQSGLRVYRIFALSR